MKFTKTAILASAGLALSLAACSESPTDEKADAVEDSMNSKADRLEDQGVISDQQEEQMNSQAEATADAIEKSAPADSEAGKN